MALNVPAPINDPLYIPSLCAPLRAASALKTDPPVKHKASGGNSVETRSPLRTNDEQIADEFRQGLVPICGVVTGAYELETVSPQTTTYEVRTQVGRVRRIIV